MPPVLHRALALALIPSAGPTGCGDQIVGRFGPETTGGASSGGDPTTTAAPPPDSSGAPTEPEQCDGLDNDGDGLVDEVAADLSTCNDCQLLQGAGQAWWACAREETWVDAQAYCQTLGAQAAIIHDEAAQAFVHAEIGEGWYWLGAHQDPDEGPWRWVDDTPLTYDNWGTTQPDNADPGQDCVRLTFGIVGEGWFDGAWDDFFCDDPHQVLCSAPHPVL